MVLFVRIQTNVRQIHVTLMHPVLTLMEDLNANVMLDMMVMVSAVLMSMNVASEPITAVQMVLVRINRGHSHANVMMDSTVMELTVLTLMNV